MTTLLRDVSRSPLRLYSYHLSGHSHRAILMCSLLGLDYELEEVNMREGAHKSDAFLRLNPFGQVPVLVDGEHIISDSNAIIVYLASVYDPERRWYPNDPLFMARVQRWLSMAAGELVAGPAVARAARVFNRPTDERPAAIAARLLAFMDRELSRAPYLCGERPSIADVAMYSYTAHAPEGGIDLRVYPHIVHWVERIETLEGFVGLVWHSGGTAGVSDRSAVAP